MANITKIVEVEIHIGSGTDTEVDEAFACKQFLVDNEIPHKTQIHMFYGDDETKLRVLSSQVFGLDFTQHEFTKFPVVTWKEYYDDYERCLQVARTVSELADSNIVKFSQLLQK